MSKRAKWWWAVVGALAVITIGGAAALTVSKRSAADAAKKRETPVLEFAAGDVVRLQSKRLSSELVLPGSVQAISQATVRAKLSAEVKRVLVREGDRVRAGQTIAEFDTAQLRAQLAERKATHESAKAQLATTERTRQANAQLVKQNFPGYVNLEYEIEADAPLPGMRKSFDFMRKAAAAL